MGGEELFFILLVVGFVGLFLYKLANVFSLGRLYGDLVSWLSFIGGLICWSLGFLLSIVGGSSFLYFSVVYRFVNAFLIIYFFLHLFEIFFTLAQKPVSAARDREGLGRGRVG